MDSEGSATEHVAQGNPNFFGIMYVDMAADVFHFVRHCGFGSS